ncbi:MAG: energy-coupling factor ABC transporter permease [Lachnospiraceae bacterium]|nr:energy-coupling factor ABC transporter permease [Lachnospiraceae bacterium]
MHMADALLAPTVAATMYVASGAAAGVSVYNLKKDDEAAKLPVMGVMAAFVFAGQMINYTIPGTGSSGHLCGGMLLSSLLGPYAGFLSMIVILAIQGLFFADGGLMALGANCWNMAFYGCFIGYFLIYRPIMKKKGGNTRLRLIVASILGCMITLQLGAFSVCIETFASGISELPFAAFVGLMQPIHLAIGLIEGVITAAVLVFVYQTRPELLEVVGKENSAKAKLSVKSVVAVLAIAAVLIGGIGSQFASSNPDGLEWSLFGNADEGYSANMGLDEEEFGVSSGVADTAAEIQEKTAFLPDYAFSGDEENPVGTSVSGILGGAMVALAAVVICLLGGFFKKRKTAKV